jgi:hypothetical protein
MYFEIKTGFGYIESFFQFSLAIWLPSPSILVVTWLDLNFDLTWEILARDLTWLDLKFFWITYDLTWLDLGFLKNDLTWLEAKNRWLAHLWFLYDYWNIDYILYSWENWDWKLSLSYQNLTETCSDKVIFRLLKAAFW